MTSKKLSPIFIGGLFKSGTSLLRAMLGQHSSIAAGLESYWFDLDWDGPRDEKFRDHIDRLRKFYDMDEATIAVLISKSKTTLDFLDRFMMAYTNRIGKKRWAEKTPGNIMYLDRIYNEFPEAKFIHIIRDPKDVFASLRQISKWDSVQVFVEMWCRFFGTEARLKKELEPGPEKYTTIRYESLIMDPVHTMCAVVKFLEEEWEDSVAQFSGKNDEYEKVLTVTGIASTTLDRLRKPLGKNRIGIWESTLQEEEIIAVRDGVRENGLLPLFTEIEENTISLLDKIEPIK